MVKQLHLQSDPSSIVSGVWCHLLLNRRVSFRPHFAELLCFILRRKELCLHGCFFLVRLVEITKQGQLFILTVGPVPGDSSFAGSGCVIPQQTPPCNCSFLLFHLPFVQPFVSGYLGNKCCTPAGKCSVHHSEQALRACYCTPKYPCAAIPSFSPGACWDVAGWAALHVSAFCLPQSPRTLSPSRLKFSVALLQCEGPSSCPCSCGHPLLIPQDEI